MKRLIKKSNLSLREKLEQLKSQFVMASQEVLDDWKQDDDGYDEILGYGGICQDIADAITDVCNKNGINCFSVQAWTEEQHVWSMAYEEWEEVNEETISQNIDDNEDENNSQMNGEAYVIDISPYVYETGSGFVWKKKKGVQLSERDIDIFEINYETLKDWRDNDI